MNKKAYPNPGRSTSPNNCLLKDWMAFKFTEKVTPGVFLTPVILEETSLLSKEDLLALLRPRKAILDLPRLVGL